MTLYDPQAWYWLESDTFMVELTLPANPQGLSFFITVADAGTMKYPALQWLVSYSEQLTGAPTAFDQGVASQLSTGGGSWAADFESFHTFLTTGAGRDHFTHYLSESDPLKLELAATFLVDEMLSVAPGLLTHWAYSKLAKAGERQ